MKINILDNITFLFTNKNTCNLLQGAINSLLDYYPEHRNNIVVFDDYSTDDSRNWLEKNNIKWITWKKYKNWRPYLIQERPGIENHIFNYIIYDASSQVSTKYIILCDSDIIFLNGGFLEKYEIFFNENPSLKMICSIFNYKLPVPQKINKTKYGKYMGFNSTKNYYYLPRIHSYFCMYDLDFFKKENLLYDDYKDEEYNSIYGDPAIFKQKSLQGGDPFVESGSDWLFKIKEKNIEYINIAEDQYDTYHGASYLHPFCIHTHTTNPDCYIYHIGGGATIQMVNQSLVENPITKEYICRELIKDPELHKILGKYHNWIKNILK